MRTLLVFPVILIFTVLPHLSHAVSPTASPGENTQLNKCLSRVDRMFVFTYETVMPMIDVEANDRLEEARRHYFKKPDSSARIKLDPIKSCADIRSNVEKYALEPAGRCFHDEGLSLDHKSALALLARRLEIHRDLLEVYYGCKYGTKTGDFFRELGVFDLMKLERTVELVKERDRCLNMVVEAIDGVHDEIMRLVDDDVASRLERTRKFYVSHAVSLKAEPESSSPAVCKQIEAKTKEALAVGNRCFSRGPVMGFNKRVMWTSLARGSKDSTLDVLELSMVCRWAERSAELMQNIGILDAIADPKRMASLKSKQTQTETEVE